MGNMYVLLKSYLAGNHYIEQDQRKTQIKENQFTEYVNFVIIFFRVIKSNSPHNRMAILGIYEIELNQETLNSLKRCLKNQI